MSSGVSCGCEERGKPLDKRNWVLMDYRCNHSAFNSYHFTPSRYSEVFCLECKAMWRTKASYADDLNSMGRHYTDGIRCEAASRPE